MFGAEFTFVAPLDRLEDGAWRYAFSWRDNVSPLSASEVKFPVLTVPREDEDGRCATISTRLGIFGGAGFGRMLA